MAKKRVLLTGGTGFVGANLAHRLIAAGHKVAVLAREGSHRTRLVGIENELQFLSGDVTDAKAIRRVVEQVDPEVVFHLASTAFNPPTISAQTHMQVIAMGTLNLLESLVGCAGVRIISAGSVAEYGGGSRLQEDSLLLPGTILGAAKAAGAVLMQTYARLYQMETVVLRFFVPYGPWEHPRRLIPHTILSALAGQDVPLSHGHQQRDFVYVDDLVDALILAASRPLCPGSVFNIGSGVGIPIREIVELVLKLMGNPVKALVGALPMRTDEITEMSADITAARAKLGWCPRTPLEDGLRKSINWFTEHRELAVMLT